MSLLLDALRRAGSARGDDIAEPVSQPPAAGDSATTGRPEPDEFDLDIDTATAAETNGASDGTAGAVRNSPARAEAVFRGGASGSPVIRTTALFTLGTAALLGGLLVGGWYYYESTRSAVDRELARYAPDPATARNGSTTGGGADPSAGDAFDPDALDAPGSVTAHPEGTNTANSSPSGTDTGAPEVDFAAALAATPQSGSGNGGAGNEPSRDAASATGEATAGDAGMAATGTERTDDDAAASTGADAEGEDSAPDPAESERSGTPSASTATPDNGMSTDDVRPEADASDAPMVRRTGSGDRRSPLVRALQEGYRALRGGDLMSARRYYRRAVELDPSNRDARLGAAAVAQRQGNAAAAIGHYRKVLADHPRDPYARSGLASLESTADPRRIESELKTLLKQDPGAHALRYALGNLYAREDRWSQAQSAYFEAFRAARTEADYAFNLAVALDQLGQREAAVEYYGEALELAGDGSASFPLESARRRLESLRP